jgi:hypothetical protein
MILDFKDGSRGSKRKQMPEGVYNAEALRRRKAYWTLELNNA